MQKSYDLVVIGGGPGGYVAAIHAAKKGLKTALIEADFMGGTCLNRGCIPSKTYLKHSEIIDSIEMAKDWGIETTNLTFSFSKMKKRKDEVIERLRSGIHFLLTQEKIVVYKGKGIILARNQIKVSMEKKEEYLHAAKIIIATGSMPAIPPILGLDSISYETSDTIFDLKEIPKSIVIIGGGVIGMEFACIFSSLQTKVTVIEAADTILPTEDKEASSLVMKSLKNKGITFHINTKVKEIQSRGEKKSIICVDSKNKEFISETDLVLISTGRQPNLSAISHLIMGRTGPFIQVNEKMETSVPNIYAIGDVIGGWQLAHVASSEGIIAASNVAGETKSMDYKVIPRCVYTFPEIATVGMLEEEIKQRGISYRTEKFSYNGNGKAQSSGDLAGFTKVLFEEKYGEILGVVMVGSHVTEMISEASAFIHLEGTIEEIVSLVHPHPTVSETFYEAALNYVHSFK
jgi:dihydrolipoamide dehydrogenase